MEMIKSFSHNFVTYNPYFFKYWFKFALDISFSNTAKYRQHEDGERHNFIGYYNTPSLTAVHIDDLTT